MVPPKLEGRPHGWSISGLGPVRHGGRGDNGPFEKRKPATGGDYYSLERSATSEHLQSSKSLLRKRKIRDSVGTPA